MSKWPRCPKCKSKDLEIIEIWTATISWGYGEPYFNEGALNPGDPFKVVGNCLSCGHHWRFRRLVQVNPEWFEEENS